MLGLCVSCLSEFHSIDKLWYSCLVVRNTKHDTNICYVSLRKNRIPWFIIRDMLPKWSYIYTIGTLPSALLNLWYYSADSLVLKATVRTSLRCVACGKFTFFSYEILLFFLYAISCLNSKLVYKDFCYTVTNVQFIWCNAWRLRSITSY